MAKMTAIYRTPQDKERFLKHYYEVHIPLAKQLPGLVRYEVSKGAIMSTTGHTDIFLIGNLYFESLDALKAAFASETGKQCAADRKILAPSNEDVQIYVYDTRSV